MYVCTLACNWSWGGHQLLMLHGESHHVTADSYLVVLDRWQRLGAAQHQAAQVIGQLECGLPGGIFFLRLWRG